MPDLLPLFVNLAGRRVVVVGGGPVAASKLASLRAAGADVRVVAPNIHPDIERAGVAIERRAFAPSDLDGAWLVVAAATAEVNRQVAAAAETRRVFVNAVDDPASASAYLSGVVRRHGVTLAISTNGDAPGLTALLREALDAVLPADLGQWMEEARRQRTIWRRDGVPMASRRPLLLEALNALYDARLKPRAPAVGTEMERDAFSRASGAGRVSLVGAGPGDPGLLTRTALARLRAADLVLYDALVDQRVVALARRARRFFVGKRAGRHALSQADIDALMIRAARRGRHVVRLKGGDPFVFGRGGEEAMSLVGAGVPFDVVPGVTSVAAAPALAGIPLTYRGVASALLVVSGHDEDAFGRLVDHVRQDGVTLVVLMGLARRTELADILLRGRWRPETPAAVVVDASSPRQQTWRGTLAEMGAGRATVEGDGPGLIVVGDVAALDFSADAALAGPEETQEPELRRNR